MTGSASSTRPRRRPRLAALLRWTSGLLILLFLALFALSFIRYDVIEHNRGTLTRPTPTDPSFHHILRSISIFNGRGAAVISWWSYESIGPTEESMRVWKDMYGFRFEHSRPGPMGFRTWFEYEDRLHWRFAGIGVEVFNKAGTTGTALLIPHWLPLLACATPWFFHAATFRARRRRAGLCARCGYERAGLAPEQPCPECGKPSAS